MSFFEFHFENICSDLFAGIYLFLVMSSTSISIMITICILHTHHVGPRQKRMSPRTRNFFLYRLAGFLRMETVVNNFLQDQHAMSAGIGNFPRPARNLSAPDIVRTYEELETLQEEGRAPPSEPINIESLQNAQFILKNTSRYAREKKEQMRNADEWKLLAIILDRVFFWICSLMLTFISVGVLVLMPLHGEFFSTKSQLN